MFVISASGQGHIAGKTNLIFDKFRCVGHHMWKTFMNHSRITGESHFTCNQLTCSTCADGSGTCNMLCSCYNKYSEQKSQA